MNDREISSNSTEAVAAVKAAYGSLAGVPLELLLAAANDAEWAAALSACVGAVTTYAATSYNDDCAGVETPAGIPTKVTFVTPTSGTRVTVFRQWPKQHGQRTVSVCPTADYVGSTVETIRASWAALDGSAHW